jgi:hypothetical protein
VRRIAEAVSMNPLHIPSSLLRRLPAALLLAFLLTPAAGQTVPPGYEIVDITSNNDRHEQFPRINNNGQVVFGSRVIPGNTQAEIWLYDGRTGELTQITDDDVYDLLPDIADDGTIVWMRAIGPDPGTGPTAEIMMRTPDGVVTRITDNAGWDWQPTVNNRRQIVWSGEGPPACGGWVSDIYLYDAGRIVPITTNGAPESVENQAPEINDFGEIVWTEYDWCNPPPPYNFTSRVMLYSGGATRPLSATLTPQAADINNGPHVVWSDLNVVTGNWESYLWESGAPVMLTDDGLNLAINDLGDIVFHRWDDVRSVWDLWFWRDGEFTQFTQDAMDQINPAINNRGEVVWSLGPTHIELDVRLLRRFNPGDLNCDGVIDAFDIEPFVVALMDPVRYRQLYPTCDPALADINEDGAVDAFDIEPLVALLGGHP